MTEAVKKPKKQLSLKGKENLKKRRFLEGVVVKKSSDRTIKVEVVTHKSHPLYGKRTVRSKRYLVDDAEGKAEVGQTVVIGEARPLSRRKKYVLIDKK